jgi:hypothetical protein
MQCSCIVSIIYSTPKIFAENSEPAVDEEMIKEGNELVAEADRVAESHIRRLARRSTEPPNYTEFSTLE